MEGFEYGVLASQNRSVDGFEGLHHLAPLFLREDGRVLVAHHRLARDDDDEFVALRRRLAQIVDVSGV
jgi:hypothetical protein